MGLTAWQALFDSGDLQAGENVLVHAASGGVGHMAVQLAHYKGAHVIGTASESNDQFVKDLGVNEFLDYHHQEVSELTQGVDLVIGTVAGEALEQSAQILNPGGRIVALVGQEQAADMTVDTRPMRTQPNAEELARKRAPRHRANNVHNGDLTIRTCCLTLVMPCPSRSVFARFA